MRRRTIGTACAARSRPTAAAAAATRRPSASGLPKNPRPPRSQCDADAGVAVSRGGPRQPEVGDVRAGDREHHRGGAEENPERLPDVAQDVLLQRDDAHVKPRVLRHRRPVFALHAPGQNLERRVGRGDGDVRTEACLEVDRPVGPIETATIEGEREIDLRIPENESPRHHSDDGVGLSLDLDRASDDAGVAGEAALPEPVGKNGDLRSAGHVLRRVKTRPRRGRTPSIGNPEAEICTACRRSGVPRPVRLKFPRHSFHGVLEDRRLALEIRDLGNGEGNVRLIELRQARARRHDAVGALVGPRIEERALDEREDGDARTGGDAEHQDRRGREAHAVAQRPDGLPEVLPDGRHRPSSGQEACASRCDRKSLQDRAIPGEVLPAARESGTSTFDFEQISLCPGDYDLAKNGSYLLKARPRSIPLARTRAPDVCKKPLSEGNARREDPVRSQPLSSGESLFRFVLAAFVVAISGRAALHEGRGSSIAPPATPGAF